ncbi:FixH family protein [Cytobacillus sp. FJAT-53684]|uniref:FixH family protein n=1 Tax=Cytobacillus mangrovibacter TaxID=3299024 RepID=A0ABW6K0U7_9BACI
MKKGLYSISFVLLFMLAACSSGSSLEITVEKELYFQKEKTSEFAIKVTDQDEPVEDLEITAEFAMVDMDHGKYEVNFTEEEKGIYSSEVELPMAGEWEIVFTISEDGKEVEKVIEYDVKEPEGVATINGDWVTTEDIEFYRFINELHIAINREQAEEKYEGKELEGALANLDDQEQAVQDQNTLLTQIIRLRSVALLGLEKGHEASREEVKKAIESVREQYGQSQAAQNLIKEFGEDKFWDKQEKQYELIVLSQKVQTDLINKVKEANPDVNEQEILYQTQKQYEELLVSQVNSLNIVIL